MESPKAETIKQVPWQIFATITILIGLGAINIINHSNNEWMYFHFVVRVIVSFGLLYRQKWAFITILVLGVIHILFFLFMKEIVMSLANLLFASLIASTYRFFFPESETEVKHLSEIQSQEKNNQSKINSSTD